jgi:hypothetical protein
MAERLSIAATSGFIVNDRGRYSPGYSLLRAWVAALTISLGMSVTVGANQLIRRSAIVPACP